MARERKLMGGARAWAALWVMVASGVGAEAAPPIPPPAISSTAEAVYASARPRLLQIRTLVDTAGRQASLGSGFVISADGFALTNYHVVSQYVLEPQTYRLEYVAADGASGSLKVHAIDVPNDLAVLRLDRKGLPYFQFESRAIDGAMPKGERLFAMGNPLDIGFTIVEGTYNGLVEKSYSERIHFTGALNPGMSGGPTVTTAGRIAGVNVAKQVSGELVSFLVAPHLAAALVERARTQGPLAPEKARAEITRQLTTWQAALYTAITREGFRPASYGPYRAPESAASWFSCWSRTNADAVPKPRATVNTTNCRTKTWLFVANDLSTGQIEFSHSYVRSLSLNAFQFSAFLSEQYRSSWIGGFAPKRLTRQKCHEDFVATGTGPHRPLLRVVFCARAYREFEGLYDVTVAGVTEDRAREALVSRLEMHGVGYDNAVALGKRFLAAMERP